jgi:glycyl-tRNA synthetase beta chain
MTDSPQDFLVEIGTEELPPRALAELSEAFVQGIVYGLAAARLEHGTAVPYATPRRLAVLVPTLAARQLDQEIRRRGPPISAAFDAQGKPTRAATAFAETCGTDVENLGRVREGKGEYLFYTGTQTGAATTQLLSKIVTDALAGLPIPKRMRWGSGDAEFARPVHWAVMLFGRDVVPATLLGVMTGNETRGHRFHAPQAIPIVEPSRYSAALRERGHVIADLDDRRERIRKGVIEAASRTGRQSIVSEELLAEVAALVEWPVPIVGKFDERFLELPREVLIATLQDHQRYFPVEDSKGNLAATFVAVSNIESREPLRVVNGNERVVRARLADAAYFWHTDRKRSLASRIEALKGVTFQIKLGSVYDKTQRVRALAKSIAATIGCDAAIAVRAAELAKCDLVTNLVGEFPGLQGTMGGYYARHDKEPDAVAQAIAEQYLPRFAGDRLPASQPGVALAMADKLDTICGVFAIGQKPTGARDPFGLRRAALGVLRIAIELRLEFDLKALIDTACAAQPVQNSLSAEIYDYMMERLRVYYLEGAGLSGMTSEIFDAVLVNQPASPLDFDARVRAVADFLLLPEAPALTAANKRIANILRQAADARVAAFSEIDRKAFEKNEERSLFAALETSQLDVGSLLRERRYAQALKRLAALRVPVDQFFDAVMVMHEDPRIRAQRLGLLRALRELFMHTADLSRLGS